MPLHSRVYNLILETNIITSAKYSNYRAIKMNGFKEFLIILPWLLIVSSVKTSKQETQDTGLGEERSLWIKTIPPIDSKLKLDKENSQIIRNRMDGKVTNVIVPFLSDTSPSFDLLSKDLRDETYLDPKTISTSHRDIIRQSPSKLSTFSSVPSCNAQQVGHKIMFSHCPGELIMVTIGGTMKMSCRDIEAGVYYGPVIMKSEKCTQSFVFQRECNELKELKIKSTECGTSMDVTLYIVQSISCALIILGLIFLFYG